MDKKHTNIYFKLIKELNTLPHPDYLNYITIIERESPIDTDLFKGKNINQIFEIVKNTPFKNPLLSNSKILLTFEDYVENNPINCSKKSSELENSNSNIQYMLFSGLEKAVKKDKEINWRKTLQLIKNIIISIDKNHACEIYDIMLGICNLIETGFKKDSIKFQLRGKIWEIIQLLVETSVDTPRFNSCLDKNNAYNVSRNNSNGMSFYLVYQYSVWCQKHYKSKKLMCEVKLVFDKYLNEKSAHTISRNVVLGMSFQHLYRLDQQWSKTIFSNIRFDENARIAFWNGHVRKPCNREIFENFSQWYAEFLHNKTIKTNGLKYLYNFTVNHVMYAYLYDWNHAKHIVEKFLKQQVNNKNESRIEDYIYQINEIIQNQKYNLKINEDKLSYLLNHELFSQHDLNCWLKHDALNKEKIILSYLKYLEKYKKKFNLVAISCDAFRQYINSYHAEVAKCVDILIQKRDSNYIPDEEIKNVLTLLLAIKDEQTNKMCGLIIDKICLTGRDWHHLLKPNNFTQRF